MFAIKFFFGQFAIKELYNLKISNKKLPQLIIKENDLASVT